MTDRKSISGYCIKLFGNLISWCSKKQSMVTLSSTESEFVAVCITSCEILNIKNLLNDLCIKIEQPFYIMEDNRSTIKLLRNFENDKRCKHIDVKLHFILDLINEKIIDVEYVSTDDQFADVFTKSLCFIKFNRFRSLLGLCNSF